MLLTLNLLTMTRRLVKNWLGIKTSQPRSRRRASNPTRLAVETLESRELLTTVTVTTLADTVDPNDGVISLREALQETNNTSAADTIQFLASLNGTINLTQGELQISSPLTIIGNGAANTIINAQTLSRVLSVGNFNGNVTLDSLTFTGGKINATGGGIYAGMNGTLTLNRSTVTGNTATNGFGGGVAAGSSCKLVVESSSISGNSTTNQTGVGGGLYSALEDVVISNSHIDNNSTQGSDAPGGGMYLAYNKLTITNSTVSNNSTVGTYAHGAGIKSGSGDVTIINSTLSGNTVSGQNASGAALATGAFNGGPGNFIAPDVVVQSSTISGNTTSGEFSYGGGLWVPFGTLTVTSSTISGNQTVVRGAGILVAVADLLIQNSTVVMNTSTGQAPSFIAGGIAADGPGDVTINNSIVALNSGGDFPNLYLSTGTLTVNYSLIGDKTGNPGLNVSLVPDANGNLIGDANTPIDPVLGPLTNNGGPTATHALLDSPAINRGSDALTTAAGLTVDQTGRSRFVGSSVDMGAFEFQYPTVSFDLATVAVSETIGTYLITVNLSAASALPVTIPFTVTGTAEDPSDYTITASPLVIPAGSTSGTIELTVVSTAGSEPDETVILTLGSLINGNVGAITATTVTIVDGNTPPVVTVAKSGDSIIEGQGPVEVQFNLSFAVGVDVTIPFTVTGSANNPSDYTITSSPLVIPAGQTSGTILINVVNDGVQELEKNVIVTLNTPTNATLGASVVNTVTIKDDDFVPVVSFATATQSANESVGDVIVTINLSGPSVNDVTIPFGLTGTADRPGDYQVLDASPLVIPAGSTSGTITLKYVGDSLIEGDETAIITLGPPTNATLGAVTTNVVTITDDDFNTAPTIPAGQVFTVAENSPATTVVGTVVASDADQPAPFNTLTFSLNTNPGSAFSIDPQTGVLTVIVPSALNFEATPQLIVNVKVTDGGNPQLSFSRDITVNLTDANDAPSMTSNSTANVAENTTAVLTVTATDPDGDSLTYSISGGADAARFTINPTTGVLTFLTAPNFEDPTDAGANNVYNITVQATDNRTPALSATRNMTITVTNVNEAPTITSNSAVSVAENTTAVITVTASDPDAGQARTYSIISGADAAKFTIDGTTGELGFVTAPDFEVPTDAGANNVYNVTIQATDNGNPTLSTTQILLVTVTDILDSPVISGGSGSIVYLRRQAPVALMPSITVSSPGANTSLGKVVVNYFIPKRGKLTDITFNASGLGSLVESDATDFRKTGGTHTVTLNLNAGVTTTDVETFLNSFRFSSKKLDTARRPLNRTIDVQVFDDSGALSNKVTTTIQAKAR